MPPTDRLRIHPEDRLASPVQAMDLAAAARALRGEPHAPIAGHRQIAVFRRGPVTVLLFVFEPEGFLKEHRTSGVVTIQVLGGRLQVSADEETHELGPGGLLALAPGIPHTVRALAASEMLLTVHHQPPEADGA